MNNWKQITKGRSKFEVQGDPGQVKEVLKPSFDGILVEYLVLTEQNGVEMPSTDKKPAGFGKVLSVGDGRNVSGVLIPVSVKVGETVYYNPNSASALKFYDDDGNFHSYIRIGEGQVEAIKPV
jgi:co-chaperonin GroES (HSP10)